MGCYDLTRTAPLPASDGCPNSTSGLYTYNGHANIREAALFFQDTITKKQLDLQLGAPGGHLSRHHQRPSSGAKARIAYNLKPTSTVFKVSYARTFETPFNENLVISSLGCNDPVVNAICRSTGGPCNTAPLAPARAMSFTPGLSKPSGDSWLWMANTFGNTLTGPLTSAFWATRRSRFPSSGPDQKSRLCHPRDCSQFHGFTAFVVMSSVAARFFSPQVSGIGAVPGEARCSASTTTKFLIRRRICNISSSRRSLGRLNWRYDSGLVAGRYLRRRQLRNGPERQRFGCRRIHHYPGPTVPGRTLLRRRLCHPHGRDQFNPRHGLCPAGDYRSKFVSVPAPGTENDDHNPPRIAPRNLFDLSLGDDNIFIGDKQSGASACRRST